MWCNNFFFFIIILGSRVFKVLASLLSPTAFALGSINFADYERAQVGLRWSNMWRVNFIISFLMKTTHLLFHLTRLQLLQASSGVNFLLCLLIMAFDSLLYCALGLYCDKVFMLPVWSTSSCYKNQQSLWNIFVSVCSCDTMTGNSRVLIVCLSFCNLFIRRFSQEKVGPDIHGVIYSGKDH